PVKAIPWVEQRTGRTLSPSQRDAVAMALGSKVTVITGGPGVGKTTIVTSILQILQAKKMDVLLCAPTGRAARRLTETTGLEAKTIHRLLEFEPTSMGFVHGHTNPLRAELVVVDEVSMVDIVLMAKLLRVVTERIPQRFGLHPIRDVQVLTPMNRGSLGAHALNAVLQQALNPDATPQVTRFGWMYAPGDKVLQMVNNYEKDVYNGD